MGLGTKMPHSGGDIFDLQPIHHGEQPSMEGCR